MEINWEATLGLVSLVGAGPGDPELLTVRAARRLREADLVLYDALVDPECLALAPQARRFFVGKRAARPGLRQQAIHALMIRAARRGQRVVRLKCGDPFVFGRGGEEALALAAAGVPFEIVPGLSTALAAPALFGIPATHRGLASGFVVVSGHAEAAFAPILETLAPGSATLIVLMGLSTCTVVASLLLRRRWSPETPAAIVFGAGTSRARAWRGTLRELGRTALPPDEASPGVIVVGDVVSVAATVAARGEPAASAWGPMAASGLNRSRVD